MNTAKVTSKGQVTIPKRVRSLMAIRTGDRLHSILTRMAACGSAVFGARSLR